MKRALLVLAISSILLWHAPTRADEMNESRTPNEYTQEESHPLRVASYFVTPIGFFLEWTVSRPLHYIASESFLAPVFDSEHEYEEQAVPVEELPSVTAAQVAPAPLAEQPLHEEALGSSAQRHASPLVEQPAVPQQPPGEEGGQPVLH